MLLPPLTRACKTKVYSCPGGCLRAPVARHTRRRGEERRGRRGEERKGKERREERRGEAIY
jgi:hypothetical protein